MGNSPRALNRLFLGITGLLALTVGAGVIVLTFVPQAQQFWNTQVSPLEGELQQVLADSALNTGAGQTSLFTVLTFLLLLLAVGLLVWFIAKQPSVRSSTLLAEQDPAGHGKTVVAHGFLKQALTTAFENNPDVLAVNVTSYRVKKTSGVQVKLEVRKGTNLLAVQEQTARIMQGLDQLVGHKIPFLVRVTGGLRATFQQPRQRVQ